MVNSTLKMFFTKGQKWHRKALTGIRLHANILANGKKYMSNFRSFSPVGAISKHKT